MTAQKLLLATCTQRCRPVAEPSAVGADARTDLARTRVLDKAAGGRRLIGLIGFLLIVGAFPQRSAANIIYVTTLKDEIGGSDGCSLKDAVYSANLHNNVAVTGYDPTTLVPSVVSTQCVPGSGDDIIILP